MFFRPNQIRAARGLLDWTVSDLGSRVGVGATTISAIETGRSAGSRELLEKIYRAFSDAGVLMTEQGGVIPKQMQVVYYNGRDGFHDFFDHIYESMRAGGGRICIFNGSPPLLIKWLGDEWYKMHAERMTDIRDRFTCRVIIEEGQRNLIGSSFAEYRFISADQFNEKTIYIYGENVAFIDFQPESVTVTEIQHKETADAMQTMFDISWDNVARKMKAA